MDKEKFFPKRIKLKVKVQAPNGERIDKFLFKTFKEAEEKITEYKNIYKPEAVEFILVQGMVQIISKPKELQDNPLLGQVSTSDFFWNAPEWADNEDTIFGKGFENTLYVAKPDFSEIVKLKETVL